MRPPAAIAVDFEREPRSSSDYEEIQAQELPLHYMNEDKARRRVPKGPSSIGYPSTDDIAARDAYDDDEGKDVYNKARPIPRLKYRSAIAETPVFRAGRRSTSPLRGASAASA